MLKRVLSLLLVLAAVPAAARQRCACAGDPERPHAATRQRSSSPRQCGRPRSRRRDLPRLRRANQNTARMAGLLASWGYAALVVDSFSRARTQDACGRNWPTQADAEMRARHRRATLAWLGQQSYVDPKRLATMGYSLWRRGCPCCARCRRPGGRPSIGARHRRLSRLRAGRCAGTAAHRASTDLVRAGGARRPGRRYRMQGRHRAHRAGRDLVETRLYEGARITAFDALWPAGPLSRRRRQPQQAGRLLRRALRRQRNGMEGREGDSSAT